MKKEKQSTEDKSNSLKFAIIFLLLPVFAILTGFIITASGSDNTETSVNRFEAGAFENPANCAGCHGDIHAAWSKSKHAFAWRDEFYQPDYIKASRETEGLTDVFCGECHAPTARRTGQIPPPDGSLFDDVSKQGVHCDYCHTVSEVIEPFNIKTVSDPGSVKRGPRGDGESPYHAVKFSDIHTDPAFCGSCHNVRHPQSGVKVIDTYDDWKEGPYAKDGIRCQDCHMTPGPGVEKNPGKSSPMGEEREHVATHFFPGGSVFFQERKGNEQQRELARQMLEAAAELETESAIESGILKLLVRIKNTGAGHKIPTGVTYIRKIWLEVTVTDDKGKTVFSSGHKTGGNHIDPEAVFYRKVFKDAEGNTTPKSWLAHGIAYDRRIPAKGSDEQSFSVPLNKSGESVTYDVTVRLMYRTMSQEAADGLGIDGLEVPSIEMARAEKRIKR